MPELIISISGMRGIIGENLHPEIAARYGAAFGTFLKAGGKNGPVCIGRDSRPSGPMLASALASGIMSVGLDVVDLGIVTTPTVGILVRHLDCAGGVVVTASHNPIEYNGIKLLLDNGIAPPKPLAEQIRSMYLEGKSGPVSSIDCGTCTPAEDPDTIHIDKVLSIVDVESISACNFKVVLDSVNGAGGRPGVRLLQSLGCQIVQVNTEPSGLFAHTPEPTAENLRDLCTQVTQARAHIGFAQDPDADRLAIVDETGRYIGEEYTLGLAARLVYMERKGTAAANLSTSRMIDDIASQSGGKVIRTPVGEANVAQAMIENHCVIGGEGNGGVIDLRIGPVRDSLVAMAMVLQLMARTGKPVGVLADEIGGYDMHKSKFSADPQQARRIIDKAKMVFSKAKIDESDGCRFDLPDGWIHLRTSNTEPVMRSIIETRRPEITQRYRDAVDQIRNEIG
ncbi:MAG: phosphoglucosamine mutase [Sedimentisphaerales bacterium]|nr:phosphoglucosamine mutase [Sedimentisphaerales bacterium]